MRRSLRVASIPCTPKIIFSAATSIWSGTSKPANATSLLHCTSMHQHSSATSIQTVLCLLPYTCKKETKDIQLAAFFLCKCFTSVHSAELKVHNPWQCSFPDTNLLSSNHKVCKQQEEEEKKEQGKEKMHLSTKVRKCTSWGQSGVMEGWSTQNSNHSWIHHMLSSQYLQQCCLAWFIRHEKTFESE